MGIKYETPGGSEPRGVTGSDPAAVDLLEALGCKVKNCAGYSLSITPEEVVTLTVKYWITEEEMDRMVAVAKNYNLYAREAG
jgi:hypothetical protein